MQSHIALCIIPEQPLDVAQQCWDVLLVVVGLCCDEAPPDAEGHPEMALERRSKVSVFVLVAKVIREADYVHRLDTQFGFVKRPKTKWKR